MLYLFTFNYLFMDKLELKTALSEAKGKLKAFRRENKITDVENVPVELKTTFDELTLAVENAQDAYDEALETQKEKGKSVGARLYSYGQVKDPTSGEMREMTKPEEKKWRNHARKAGKKLGISGAEVEFDPNFFLPKVKKEKEEKPPKEKKEKEPPADKTKKVRSTAPQGQED